MKIALIAHGALSIPPPAWGAVEEVVWNHKLNLERFGHTVAIANTRAIDEVIYNINGGQYDFVHCHCEHFLLECLAHLRRPLAVTSHNFMLQHLDPSRVAQSCGFKYLLEDMLCAQANIALSDRIRDIYLRHDYGGSLHVLRNGVATDAFRFTGKGNGRAVCVGVISSRKRQGWLAEIARNRFRVDFVGPWNRNPGSRFQENETARYVGVWDKATLHERLSDYSCLVLLSKWEAAPLVVLEGLAAGLSIVVSEASAANLTQEEFITVIPDAERRRCVVAEAVQRAIDKNAAQREAIRSYARRRFDYSVVVFDYLRIIQDIREHFRSLGPWPWPYAEPRGRLMRKQRVESLTK
jgi:glycosyltransferase involved in cell wall biosynthesis